jgi:hypothetical protein
VTARRRNCIYWNYCGNLDIADEDGADELLPLCSSCFQRLAAGRAKRKKGRAA